MKNIFVAVRLILLMTLMTGFFYTAAVTFFAQAFFTDKANGSIVYDAQKMPRGSLLMAQKFSGAQFFWPRPSAADYNPLASGGSNFSASSVAFREIVKQRAALGLTGSLQFASGSGLDPHIFPADALAQVDRVGSARKLSAMQIEDLKKLVKSFTERRQLGLLGEERVNVLALNLKLQEIYK